MGPGVRRHARGVDDRRMDAVTVAEVRVGAAVLRERVHELGDDIASAYEGTRPILVTVLKGGVFFLADLVRHVPLDLDLDFLAVSPYGPGGTVRIVKDLELDVAGRHVLVVEDIVDTGLTLAYLLQVLAARGPSSLRVCTLFDRRVRRIADLPLDFVGFEVGDEFLVGYGLDVGQRFRALPLVLAVHDRAAFAADPQAAVAAAIARADGPGR